LIDGLVCTALVLYGHRYSSQTPKRANVSNAARMYVPSSCSSFGSPERMRAIAYTNRRESCTGR
jgi:hypothetical protein